ncbi:MAG: phospholipase D family protein [Steroidobacteraceae bacterium]
MRLRHCFITPADHARSSRAAQRVIASQLAQGLVLVMSLGGCASLPPGSSFPKSVSVALVHPEETRLGKQFAGAIVAHGGDSAFRIVPVGVDGFLIRAQMIDAAEKTLDLQYFIFRGDETGRLLTDALLRAADRGVRVRVLVDDGATIAGDEQIIALDAHANVQVRIFNPFAYRGHSTLRRTLEFMFHASRLDYRMHNKLLVVDNAVALVGGRNIGNQYFQMDPDSQFADDDVFAAGPIVLKLSATFDEFWSSPFAIPAAALDRQQRSRKTLQQRRSRAAQHSERHLQTLKTDGIDYAARVATGEPYAGVLAGRLPLVWARAQVVSDSPDKKNTESGDRHGRLMARSVLKAAGASQSEVVIITPYLVPAADEFKLLQELRLHQVHVRILTNSLESTPDPIAQAGYLKYRIPFLQVGVELHELRALLGNTRGSGQTAVVSRYGNYGLHAKLFVFDRERLFIGSMNLDQRSKSLNTEIGLIIDSPELAQQTAMRFEHMVEPANAYALALHGSATGAQRLVWDTEENGNAVEYTREPARSEWQRLRQTLMSWLPIAGQV